MSPTAVLEAVRAWSAEERLEFLFQCWDQLIEDGWRPEPDEELDAELDRRLDRHEADPTNVLTHEEVFGRLRKSP